MAKKTGHKGIYIDPLTDFGFKRLFGDKDLMIDFLTDVLNIKDGITNITYSNTVITGISKDDRTAIFDLYCTTGNDEHIIVEMQAVPHKNYKERTVYYGSRLIQEQSKRGKDWDFTLTPVYLINIVDFIVDEHLKEKQYLSRIQLMYTDILQPYYDKLTIIYLELPLFTKKITELKTNLDHWMYALKYLPKLARLPAVMRTGIFTRLFDLAKIAKMTKRQQNAYYKSLHDMNIIKHTINDLQSTIAALQSKYTDQGNTIVKQGNTIAVLQSNNATLQSNNAAQAQELDEYRRRYGALNGSIAKPDVNKST